MAVLWLFLRTVKYRFFNDDTVTRYLWYLYYLPMLLIPLLSVFVAASLGKPENYRLPGWTRWLYMPMGALVLLVLTNDVHQCVFSFPSAAVMWESGNSTRDIGYYMVIGSLGRSPTAVEHWIVEGASPPTDSNRTPNAAGREAEKPYGFP